VLKDLNKAFENKVRLGTMSALLVNDFLSFTDLKELLGVTDGNLASHLKSLEKNHYISVTKEFIDRKPTTRYAITTEGKLAFIKHIKAIEQLLQ
jgi:DNA-binding MarR family transcriptional regulator